MKIQFCGADRTVTGSCHLLEINGLRILLDVGLYQGSRDLALIRNSYLPNDAATFDAVILSHGHLDHCGKLPVLGKAGYNGPIYCTPATAEVARIVMEDAAKIQVEDASYLNQRNRPPGAPLVQPLYAPEDIPRVLSLFRRVRYGLKTDLGKGVSFTFYNAGHILGSAYVVIEWADPAQGGKTRRILFTADVGRYTTPIIPDPEPVPGVMDHVITESTYGSRKHAPMSEVEPQILEMLKGAITRNGRLLVPAFALGRTQTMLWYVQRFIEQKLIPPIPVFVDSPMGVEISKAYSAFREEYDQETREAIGKRDLFGLSRVTFASSRQESMAINSVRGASVIIASSPTCEFGRILHHLKNSLEHESDAVLFCGWVPPHTLGRKLQQGAKRVRVLDRWYDVRCHINTLDGLSAHADGDELIRFLTPTINASTIAHVVHGEPAEAEFLANRLATLGMGRATIPGFETSIIDVLDGGGVGIPSRPPRATAAGDGD